MARQGDYPLWAVTSGISNGLSARAALAAFREGGGHTADSTWFRLYGEVRSSVEDRTAEVGRPLNRRPTGDELTTWTTAGATGYLQQVEVYTKSRITGEIGVKPFSVTGNTLVSRQTAIRQALDLYEANSDDYGEQILGAAHVGAFRMQPGVFDDPEGE